MIQKISCDAYASSVARIKQLQGSLYDVNKQISEFKPSGNTLSDLTKKTALENMKDNIQKMLSILKRDLSNRPIDFVA